MLIAARLLFAIILASMFKVMLMKNGQTTLKIVSLSLIAAVSSVSVFAVDLNYNPELDAPKSYQEQQLQPKAKQRLPGEQDPGNRINSTPILLNDSEQQSYRESEGGWTVKAPSISSDKDPVSADKRESVRMSEEQRWQEDGKNYDDNPLNKDNYRINVEAEYTF